MDTLKTLADLREYRSQLEEAIAALEALARVQGVTTKRERAGKVRAGGARRQQVRPKAKKVRPKQKPEGPPDQKSERRAGSK